MTSKVISLTRRTRPTANLTKNCSWRCPAPTFAPEVELRPGLVFETENEEVSRSISSCRKCSPKRVVIDFNHPLAGKDLEVSFTIRQVREATPEDLEEHKAATCSECQEGGSSPALEEGNLMTLPWAQHYDPGVPLTVGPVTASLPWLLLRAAATISPGSGLGVFRPDHHLWRTQTQTARLAQALKNLGLAPGERLGIFLPNCPQLVMAYHAALRLGAVVVMLNPLLSPKELAHQLADSGARRLVLLDHFLPRVEEVRAQVDLTHIIITSLAEALPWPLCWLYPFKARREGLATGFKPGPGRFTWREPAEASRRCPSAPVPEPEDLAVLQYTGGTTGIPKAARLTHGNLMANVAQINAWLPQVRYGEERLMGLLPFSHSFGLTACLNWPMSQGAMIIVLPRFEINGFIKAMRKYRPTMLPGVPTLFVALINDPRLPKLDLSALWGCISGSAPLAPGSAGPLRGA